MSVDASLLVMAGIFWCSYLILRFFLFGPLQRVMNDRESKIEEAQTTYETVVAATSQEIEKQRAELTAARQEALAERDRKRREAQDRRLQVLAEVKEQAAAQLEVSLTELESQVESERQKLRQVAENLSGQIAQRLLGRAV